MKKIIGKDRDNKDVEIQADQATWITPTKCRLANGKIITIDPNEMACELYNPSEKTYILQNIHPSDKSFLLGANIKLLPGEFCFLPHKHFIRWVEYIGNTNDTGELIVNSGTNMFKGNKKPSAPTKWGQIY